MDCQLSQDQIEAIRLKIGRRFPEFQGVRPRVKKRIRGSRTEFSLRFETKVTLPDGMILPMSVQVVVDCEGHILKTTTSR